MDLLTLLIVMVTLFIFYTFLSAVEFLLKEAFAMDKRVLNTTFDRHSMEKKTKNRTNSQIKHSCLHSGEAVQVTTSAMDPREVNKVSGVDISDQLKSLRDWVGIALTTIDKTKAAEVRQYPAEEHQTPAALEVPTAFKAVEKTAAAATRCQKMITCNEKQCCANLNSTFNSFNHLEEKLLQMEASSNRMMQLVQNLEMTESTRACENTTEENAFSDSVDGIFTMATDLTTCAKVKTQRKLKEGFMGAAEVSPGVMSDTETDEGSEGDDEVFSSDTDMEIINVCKHKKQEGGQEADPLYSRVLQDEKKREFYIQDTLKHHLGEARPSLSTSPIKNLKVNISSLRKTLRSICNLLKKLNTIQAGSIPPECSPLEEMNQMHLGGPSFDDNASRSDTKEVVHQGQRIHTTPEKLNVIETDSISSENLLLEEMNQMNLKDSSSDNTSKLDTQKVLHQGQCISTSKEKFNVVKANSIPSKLVLLEQMTQMLSEGPSSDDDACRCYQKDGTSTAKYL